MADAQLQAIIDRQNRENARVNERIALAQRQAYTAAAELASRMGSEDPALRRVILFGSTLPGRRYRLDSDIDLAVEGGDRPRLERLASALHQSVDVIALDELRPAVFERVLEEGVVLYEAQ